MDISLASSDTVLLVVDVQEKLVPAMAESARASLVQNVTTLVDGARLCGVPVMATEQYPKGLGPTVPQVAQALKEAGAANPLAKDCFSALGQSEVLPWLRKTGRHRVVVVGIEAHVCVTMTARDLLLEGLSVHIPHDAVLSRRLADHQHALSLLQQAGAAVTTTETVLFDWLRASSHPAFREISKKIR